MAANESLTTLLKENYTN